MRAIPNLPWTALPPTLGVSGKLGQLHGPTSRSAWTGRSADLGAGLLRVSLCWRHCLPSACPTRHAQLPGRSAARQELVEDGDELAFGVPFPEIPQRLGHLTQPIATVDDRHDPSCLAEPNQRRQALRT